MAILGHELRSPLKPLTTALHPMNLRDPRKRREHEVILVAYDGPEALALLPGFQPEPAIVDLGLPVINGYGLAPRLLAAPSQRPVLLALTARSAREQAREAGVDVHLTKPVDPQRLLRLLEKEPTARGRRTTRRRGAC